MKEHKIKFIKRMSLFLLILIILILTINLIYTKFILERSIVYRQDQIYKEYISSLPEKKLDFSFFGDSHTMVAVNPQYIPNSFNFGIGAENYIITYYKLKRILDEGVEINTIVLELDLHTFSGILTNEENLFSKLWFYSDFVSYNEIKEIRGGFIIGLWIESNFPFLGKGDEFRFVIDKPEVVNISFGWVENKKNFSEIENKVELAKKECRSHFGEEERISDISFEYFIKTIELAKKNDINIIFIKYPITKEDDFVLTEKNITKEDYYKTIFNEINKTLENYYVLDYYNLYFDNPEYFGDSDHLNYNGAEVFSKSLYKDLNYLLMLPLYSD